MTIEKDTIKQPLFSLNSMHVVLIGLRAGFILFLLPWIPGQMLVSQLLILKALKGPHHHRTNILLKLLH